MAVDKITQTAVPRPARFLAKHGNRYRVVSEKEVLYFAVEDGLTKLIVENTHYWMEPTLNDLESRLNPEMFYRVSRSAIVNLNAVKEVAPLVGGSGEVILKNGARVEVKLKDGELIEERFEGEDYWIMVVANKERR